MTEKELVCRFFKDGYETKDYDAVMSYLAKDYVDHSPAAARSNARAVEILQIVAGQFTDMKIELLDVFGESGMVAARVLYDGVHTGTCMGIPATGRHIRFEALETFRVVNGKIVESWGYWPDRQIEELLR